MLGILGGGEDKFLGWCVGGLAMEDPGKTTHPDAKNTPVKPLKVAILCGFPVSLQYK